MFGLEAEKTRVAVSVMLHSGEVLNGHMFLGPAQKLRDLLNNPDRFVDFERRDSNVVLLAKDALASVAPLDLPRTDQLQRKTLGVSGFDPYQMLGITRSANPGETRAAYLAKARLYHPDKVASKDTPKEVTDYMSAMFIRIQTAYDEISSQKTRA